MPNDMPNKFVTRRTLMAATALWLLAPAAMAQTERVLDVVIFNYSSRSLFDIAIDGVRMGSAGPYPYSGRRSKIGVRFDNGPKVVTWRAGGTDGSPPGNEVTGSANRPTMGEIPTDARYLSIHIYPDNAVEFMFSHRPPVLSPRGGAIDAEYRARKAG